MAEAATKNRKAACTVKLKPNESPIRGITSIDNVAIVNLEVIEGVVFIHRPE